MRATVQPTAVVDEGVVLGDDVEVWDQSRVRTGARIGSQTLVGTNVYIGAGVIVGSRCKIQNGAQIFEGSTLGDGVFVGPGAILTNDRIPRAVTPDGHLKRSSDWDLSAVTVDHGASIGAGAIVVGGSRLGAWSVVGAGAVVTRSLDPFELVVGVPARRLGWICRCGSRIEPPCSCPTCRRSYGFDGNAVIDMDKPNH